MDLDFINGNITDSETAENKKKEKIATSGSPNVITDEIRTEARKLAESSKGLDIAVFQRKHNIQVMNVEELLS